MVSTLKVNQPFARACVRGWAQYLANQSVYFALLNVPTGTVGCEFSTTTDQITLSAAQTWQTKTKVRFIDPNGGIFGSPPSLSPLATETDYYLIRDTATTFRVASSRANAIAGTALNLPTIASGNYSVMVQSPSANWSLPELIDWEVNHPLYLNRYQASYSLEPTTFAGNAAVQKIILVTLSNTETTPLAYNAIAVIENASGVVGDDGFGTVINASLLESFNGFTYEITPESIAPGAVDQDIIYRLVGGYTA